MSELIKQKWKLILLAFFLGYLFSSWIILEGKGLSPYKLEDLINNPQPQERKLTILNALNPLEPMNPGWYFLYFPKQK